MIEYNSGMYQYIKEEFFKRDDFYITNVEGPESIGGHNKVITISGFDVILGRSFGHKRLLHLSYNALNGTIYETQWKSKFKG